MAFKINAPFQAAGEPNSIESNKEPKITAGIGTKKRAEQYKDANYAPDHTTHRKKAKTVASSSKGADIKVKAEKPKVSSAKPTKKVEPTKKQARKTKSINKKLDKAKAARDAGNIKKAERKERAAKRKAARVARKSKK